VPRSRDEHQHHVAQHLAVIDPAPSPGATRNRARRRRREPDPVSELRDQPEPNAARQTILIGHDTHPTDPR
jgi:hypothetical protein